MNKTSSQRSEKTSSQRSLIDRVSDCADIVYGILGPGHTEYIYQKALLVELRLSDIVCTSEVITPIEYKKQYIGYGRADIIIGKDIVVELKALFDIGNTLNKKVQIYMKSLGINQGLLINFPQRIGRTDTEIRKFKRIIKNS
jgi:GxxExxY protein